MRSVLEGKAAAAQTLVDSLDESQKRSAKFIKSDFKSALQAYSTKVREYDAALISIEIDPSRILIHQEDFYAVVKTMEDLIVKLEAIAIESTTSRIATVAVADPGVVKLQKITCPKFSGIPRDFTQFKRDFNHLVAIAG